MPQEYFDEKYDEYTCCVIKLKDFISTILLKRKLNGGITYFAEKIRNNKLENSLKKIAKITNLNPGEVIISLGDTHLYKDHIDSVKKQIKRYPYIFPKLEIKRDIKTLEDIENMEFTDFELLNYKCHKGIKANMIA